MPSTRVLKKIFYAIVGLVLAVGTVGALLYIVVVPDGPIATPTPSGPPEFSAVKLENVTIIPQASSNTGERVVDIVATLRNPNPRAGISDYSINFTLYDTNSNVIKEVTEATYVLPGSIHYAAALNISLPTNVSLGRVEVVLPTQPTFLRLPDTLDLPRFSLFLQDRIARPQGSVVVEQQQGEVTNSSTFDWERVEITAVGLNTDGDIIAVGKTFIGKLLVGEQREFTVQWPKPAGAVSQVIALPSTNMFREDNIVNIVGDPGSLR